MTPEVLAAMQEYIRLAERMKELEGIIAGGFISGAPPAPLRVVVPDYIPDLASQDPPPVTKPKHVPPYLPPRPAEAKRPGRPKKVDAVIAVAPASPVAGSNGATVPKEVKKIEQEFNEWCETNGYGYVSETDPSFPSLLDKFYAEKEATLYAVPEPKSADFDNEHGEFDTAVDSEPLDLGQDEYDD